MPSARINERSSKVKFTGFSALYIGLLFVLWFNTSAMAGKNRMINQEVFEQVLAASLANDIANITQFAKAGQLDALDSNGLSAVLHTLMQNRLDALQMLLNAGADPDAFDPESSKHVIDQTAFLYAGATGNNAALKILIKAGARADIYNYYGGTALIPAAEKGHVDTVRLLLKESNVDINHVNKLGWTALLEAVILSDGGKTHQQIIALLLQSGADPAFADRDGVTALQHAQSKGYSEIIKLIAANP